MTSITQLLNDPGRPDHVPGAVVVAAYKGSSPDMPLSAGRVEQYTKEATEKWHLRIAKSIPELCGEVDGVLLLSVDGRQHLEQARQVFASRKPVFIDKPFAGSLTDALEIVRLGRESGVPFFSCSGLRFASHIIGLKTDRTIGRPEGVLTFGPMPIESHVPDLFWYGIHSVEALYALMGPGCEHVSNSRSHRRRR